MNKKKRIRHTGVTTDAILWHPADRLWSRVSLVVRVSVLMFLIAGISACRAGESTALPPSDVAQSSQAPPQGAQDESPVDVEQSTPTEDPSDPDVIQQGWENSPHADAFVLDESGNNMTCARCHAPVNWLPSIDDVPESCFACKFELKAPPPRVPEEDWVDIPCKVCHEEDKGNIQPEYTWLEIAQIGEYAEVATPTELCQKCHTAIDDLPDHEVAQLGGAHTGYECTDCHNAHDVTASCGAVDCHAEVIEPATPIAGHDQDHQAVSCVACHDADHMEVGPSEEEGIWTTFVVSSEGETMASASHNIVLTANCDRCHFADNSWGLSDISEP